MNQSNLRVLVIGGGLGGLCLAQGLRKAGVDVAVYERDAGLSTRTQGHRIHRASRYTRHFMTTKSRCSAPALPHSGHPCREYREKDSHEELFNMNCKAW